LSSENIFITFCNKELQKQLKK